MHMLLLEQCVCGVCLLLRRSMSIFITSHYLTIRADVISAAAVVWHRIDAHQRQRHTHDVITVRHWTRIRGSFAQHLEKHTFIRSKYARELV